MISQSNTEQFPTFQRLWEQANGNKNIQEQLKWQFPWEYCEFIVKNAEKRLKIN